MLRPRRHHPRAVAGPTSRMRKCRAGWQRRGRNRALVASTVLLLSHQPLWPRAGPYLHGDGHSACHGGLPCLAFPSGPSQHLSPALGSACLHPFIHTLTRHHARCPRFSKEQTDVSWEARGLGGEESHEKGESQRKAGSRSRDRTERLTWDLWLRGRASWGEGGGQSPGVEGRSVRASRMPWEVCPCGGEAERGHSCWWGEGDGGDVEGHFVRWRET